MGAINKQRPRQVTLSVAVLTLLVVVQLVWSLLDIYRSWAASGAERIVLFSTFFKPDGPIIEFVLLAFLLLKILHGRNWARVIYAVIVCVEAVAIVFAYSVHLYVPAHEIVYGLVAFAAQIAAVVLLFISPGKLWFLSLRN